MGVFCPKLASKHQFYATFHGGKPFGPAVIFRVKEHDVHADIGGFQPQLPRDFEQHANPRSSVVRAIDGFADARVLVGEGPCVPVRVEHDAVPRFRMERPNVLHVAKWCRRRHGRVPLERSPQRRDVPIRGANHLTHASACSGCWEREAKRHLPRDVGVCRVGVERRDNNVRTLRAGRSSPALPIPKGCSLHQEHQRPAQRLRLPASPELPSLLS